MALQVRRETEALRFAATKAFEVGLAKLRPARAEETLAGYQALGKEAGPGRSSPCG